MTRTPKPTDEKSGPSGFVFALIGVIGFCAAAATFTGNYLFARDCGWNEVLAVALPVCLDVYSTAATMVWTSPRNITQHARAYARTSAFIGIFLSMLCNSGAHAVAEGMLRLNWIEISATVSIPPMALAFSLHLISVARQKNRRTDGETAAETKPEKRPETVSAPKPTETLAAETVSSQLPSQQPARPVSPTPQSKPAETPARETKPKGAPRDAHGRPATTTEREIERTLALIAEHGDDVSWEMVAAAIGRSRATCFRRIDDAKKGLAAGTLTLPALAPAGA